MWIRSCSENIFPLCGVDDIMLQPVRLSPISALLAAKHVHGGEPQFSQLADQHDVHEAAGHPGAHSSHRRADPALCHPHAGF